MDDVKVTLEKMPASMVEAGAKPYRAHIVGRGFDHHAEANSPAEALILAAMHWQLHSKRSSQPVNT